MPQYTEVEVSRFNRILDRLGDASMIDLGRFDLIVYGRGGQSREAFESLALDPETEVLWTRRAGPAWLRLLPFIPSHAGLVKLLNPARLKALFEELGAMAKTEIFYVPREVTTALAQLLHRDADALELLDEHEEFVYLKAQLDDYIQNEPDCYFLYDYRLGPSTAAVIRTVFTGL